MMQAACMVRVGAEQELSWILDARQGNQEAFARLVDAYQVPVYNLAYRMLGNPAEAEDAAQETFIRAYTRLDSYDPQYKFSSWILSIASHHCVDRLRRRGSLVSIEELSARQWLPDERPKPEDQVLVREQSHTIENILERLPTQYRLVIVLRYWQDLSYEEIAEMTHCTESAVKSRLHRAREMIAGMLSPEGKGMGSSPTVVGSSPTVVGGSPTVVGGSPTVVGAASTAMTGTSSAAADAAEGRTKAHALSGSF